MSEILLLGQGRDLVTVPYRAWKDHMAEASHRHRDFLNFITPEHQQVRYFVVRELPRFGRPIEPESIASQLNLPLARVLNILDELERKLLFLVRNEQGAVSWAFPVTADQTPHHLAFSSGETLYAAWGEDAIAAAFVQGRLLDQYLSVDISTECAHCGRPLNITLDSDLAYTVRQEDAQPLVFEPHVDIRSPSFAEPNIINAYWRNSYFFWSEEHAREYRAAADHIDGALLTLDQSAEVTRLSQGALFGFH